MECRDKNAYARGMELPFKNLTKFDWILWGISVLCVLVSNILSPKFDALITVAALIGVTSLIFAAKGNLWSQILMIIFSILYGIISYRFHYWGEMVSYLGMTLPMSVWATIVWFRNPSQTAGEVAVGRMNAARWGLLILVSAIVTMAFYYILEYFGTPNIIFSTISIITSFMAVALTLFRSSYYAVLYAANDLVLIILWVLATIEEPVYFPVIVNFVIFFINDSYGFISWKKREIKN